VIRIGLSISSVIAVILALSIVGAATTTISQLSSIDVVISAYAFPCKAGIGEDYCMGYHAVIFQLIRQ
jgi:hypothetical protein